MGQSNGSRTCLSFGACNTIYSRSFAALSTLKLLVALGQFPALRSEPLIVYTDGMEIFGGAGSDSC